MVMEEGERKSNKSTNTGLGSQRELEYLILDVRVFKTREWDKRQYDDKGQKRIYNKWQLKKSWLGSWASRRLQSKVKLPCFCSQFGKFTTKELPRLVFSTFMQLQFHSQHSQNILQLHIIAAVFCEYWLKLEFIVIITCIKMILMLHISMSYVLWAENNVEHTEQITMKPAKYVSQTLKWDLIILWLFIAFSRW